MFFKRAKLSVHRLWIEHKPICEKGYSWNFVSSPQSSSPSAKKNMQIWKFPPPSHPVLGILVSKCNASFSLVNLLRPKWAVHSSAFCSSRFQGTRPKVNLWGGAFFEFYPPGCARNSTVLRKWIIQIWNLIPGLYQRSLLLLSLNVFVCALSIQ